jgi:cholesterol oxidase
LLHHRRHWYETPNQHLTRIITEAALSNRSADIIVIGSGFGGAVAADRLVRAGLRVMVLERGPWRRTAPVLAKGLEQAVALPIQNRPGLILRNIRSTKGPREIRLNRRGLLELHAGNGVKTLSSSSVGGGSHVWSALVSRPDDKEYWNGRAEAVSESLMAPHYARVAEELGAVHPSNTETLPNHTSHAWRDTGLFTPFAEADQYPFAFLFPQQHGGRATTGRELSRLNGEDGMFGSAGAAKANVEAIYLLPHLDRGLTVHDMVEVMSISRDDSGSYEVKTKDHHANETRSFIAPRVILAAGTLNSVKILCASQESGGLRLNEQLGRGFGTNGDCLGGWQPNIEETNSRLGTPIHGRLKTYDHPQGINLIIGGVDTIPLPRWMPGALKTWMVKQVQRKYQLIAMGVDRADGKVSFAGNRLRLDYDLNHSAVYQSTFSMLDKLSEESGVGIKFERKSAVTAHPMGGCRIGSSPDEGVVDGRGEVYGNPGLYVTDASVLPEPTGGPPSLSIAAWSAHVAAMLVSGIKAP